MAVETLTILSKSSRTNFQGTRGPVTLHAAATRINNVTLRLDSTNAQGVHNFLAADHILCTVQVSTDGGLTWRDDLQLDTDGGGVDHLGNPVDPFDEAFYDDNNRLQPGWLVQCVIVQTGTYRLGLFLDVDYT